MAIIYQDALEYHRGNIHTGGTDRPGKIGIHCTKPTDTRQDLGLAYTPGVALPCLKIQEDVRNTYQYTARGNTVAVISNGTAVLGLGNLGAAASGPVMEGKCVLFKKFADIDAIPILIDETDPVKFVSIVKSLQYSFGGINLEDIKAPECFAIEDALKKILDIPVFHDDQHGTAIVVTAGMINALDLAKKRLQDVKIVVNGAGSAGIACIELLKSIGVTNIILCDTQGVVSKDRTTNMNPWKTRHAVTTSDKTLQDALHNADVFLGVSAKNILSANMIKQMAPNPIIFALANPDPEVLPHIAHQARDDILIATGRSDFPNQVNNVLCFPYLFRGALDARVVEITDNMKIAAAKAIASVARLRVSQEVCDIYGNDLVYGKNYFIPTPFDSRLRDVVPKAIIDASMQKH